MYYQGKCRPVYFQNKKVVNPCQECANNSYTSFGDEKTCNECKEYISFRQRTKIDEARIKLFTWLNKKGLYAKPTTNFPFVEFDWRRMGKESRP